MAVRKVVIFILIIMVLFTATGCWDAMDVNDKGIVTSIAFDKKNEDNYIYIEIPNLSGAQRRESEGKDNNQELFSIVFGKGKTLVDAREALDNKLDKPAFFGTIRTTIITDDMAKDGIETLFHTIHTSPEFRKDVGTITTFEEIEDLFSVNPENNISVGYAIEETIASLVKKGIAVQCPSSEILELL